MKIIVKNQTSIPNKYVRLLKWKIYGIKEKFNHLLYAEVFINEEGQNPKDYICTMKLGVPGNDIVINQKSRDLNKLWYDSLRSAERYLNKYKDKRIDRSRRRIDQN
ncbi:MAG: hypothetical protein HKN09_01475 [Saprospiraceae bacterium]|nr:hypothetical protein [Saprospiraceae bacterium]